MNRMTTGYADVPRLYGRLYDDLRRRRQFLPLDDEHVSGRQYRGDASLSQYITRRKAQGVETARGCRQAYALLQPAGTPMIHILPPVAAPPKFSPGSPTRANRAIPGLRHPAPAQTPGEMVPHPDRAQGRGRRHRRLRAYAAGGVCNIGRLVVHPDRQRRGIGADGASVSSAGRATNCSRARSEATASTAASTTSPRNPCPQRARHPVSPDQHRPFV